MTCKITYYLLCPAIDVTVTNTMNKAIQPDSISPSLARVTTPSQAALDRPSDRQSMSLILAGLVVGLATEGVERTRNSEYHNML